MYGEAYKTHNKKLFTVQKHCFRVLFGYKEAYLNKFKTSARTRPLDDQKLGENSLSVSILNQFSTIVKYLHSKTYTTTTLNLRH